jgi:hypothetical protein
LRGEPLLFSTSFAHDLSIDFSPSVSLGSMRLSPDAFDGGLILADTALGRGLEVVSESGLAQTDLTVRGTLRGSWGFRAFQGPSLTFQRSGGDNWRLTDANALIAGKDEQIALQGCISHIKLTNADGSSAPITFFPVASEPSAMSLKIPLQGRQPGRYSLELQQYGISIPRVLPVTVYSGDTQTRC